MTLKASALYGVMGWILVLNADGWMAWMGCWFLLVGACGVLNDR